MHADHEKTMAHDFPLGMLWWCLLNGRASMQHVTGSSKQPGEHAATASALAQGFPDGGAMLVGWQSGQACAGRTLTVKNNKGCREWPANIPTNWGVPSVAASRPLGVPPARAARLGLC